MKKMFSTLLAIVLSVAALGIIPSFAEDKPKVIRYGNVAGSYGRPLSGGAIGYIQAKHLFEDEFAKDGITIEWNYIKGAGPGIQEALANNALDFGGSGDLPAIAGRAGGLKTRVIAASRGGNIYVVVPADSPIQSINEIKGKKVGISLGTHLHSCFIKVLLAQGMSEKDVNFVNADNATLNIAISTKTVDVAIVGSAAFALRNKGVGRIIYDTRTSPPYYQSSGTVLVRDEFARKYPDIVRRFVKVWLQGQYLASLNKNETLKFNTRTGASLAELREDAKGKSLLYDTSPKFDEQWVSVTKKNIALYKERRLIRKTFDPEKEWIDKSFLNAALKELKLENHWPDYDENGKPIKK